MTLEKQPTMHLKNSLAGGSALRTRSRVGWCHSEAFFGPLDIRIFAFCAVLSFLFGDSLHAEQQVRLRSGLILRGSVVEVASLNQNAFSAGAGGGEVQVRPIWMVDDGLRRTYIYKSTMVADVTPIEGLSQKIEFWQPAPLGGKIVAGLGPILGMSPFNDYGRRVVNVRGPDGIPLSIIQGITEVNARYAKIEGLKSTPSYTWDMRVATDSIPAYVLQNVFARRIDQDNYDRRLEVVRLYIEAQRFGDAREELERAIRDFPDEPRLATQLQALVQRQGSQLLDEVRLRRDAGQYQLATDILKSFPLAEVARVTRLEVQDALDSIEGRVAEGRRLLAQLRGQINGLVDGAMKTALSQIADEMDQSLSLDTLARLNDYSRLGGVDNIPTDSRIALAIGGWLLGPGAGLQNLSVAVSLIEVRSLVFQYLGTQDEPTRKTILEKLRGLEGAEPGYVEKILPLLPPPLDLPEEAKSETVAGMYVIDEKITGRASGDYVIQLPPEYNPLRPYPCIVALHSIDGDAEGQLNYWAGTPSSDGLSRLGQGARHGFVVIAPRWTRMGQNGYESTPREHAEVLSALRDAMRRVSIDSDRVFLTGIGAGGTAAWDIAVSHPDLWAGMICISGEPTNYMRHYNENASYIPLYLVFGEIAGAPAPLVKNGDVLDDYMAPGFDSMVVMYRGRGGESFYEEIHHLFDWMRVATHKRGDPPQKIETATMRKGDQFFWWLEIPELIENIAIDPILWDQAKRIRASKVSASVGEKNQIRINQGPAERFLVYLSPAMGIKMDETVSLLYRSRRVNFDFDGSVDFMLEDARTRADRKRPYWASVLVP